MIELTLKSGKPIMINPDKINTMESVKDMEGMVTEISFGTESCYVREDILTVMNKIVQHHFFGGDSNG